MSNMPQSNPLAMLVAAALCVQAGCAGSEAERRDPRTDPVSAQAPEARLPPASTLNDLDPLLAPPPPETTAPPAPADASGMKRDMPGMKPDMPGMKPDMPGMKPDMPNMKPDMPGMKHGKASMKPDMPEMKPEPAVKHDLRDMKPATTPPSPNAPATVYVCPMHADVRRPAPGRCPKCGMKLMPAPPADGGQR